MLGSCRVSNMINTCHIAECRGDLDAHRKKKQNGADELFPCHLNT